MLLVACQDQEGIHLKFLKKMGYLFCSIESSKVGSLQRGQQREREEITAAWRQEGAKRRKFLSAGNQPGCSLPFSSTNINAASVKGKCEG